MAESGATTADLCVTRAEMFLGIAGMYRMYRMMTSFTLELCYVIERTEQTVSLQRGVAVSEVWGKSEGEILQDGILLAVNGCGLLQV